MKQLFSLENFMLIYQYENRKGHYLDKLISNNLHELSNELLKINIDIRNSTNKEKIKKLFENKKNIFSKKDEILNNKLENISYNIRNNKFNFIFKKFRINGKIIYFIDKSPEIFFVLKKLQYNIKHSFKVKPANRYEITNQVKNLLDNNFPKYVIRTDIKNFYESISHKKLKEKINKNEIFSSFSKKMLNKILNNFQSYTKNSKGIPRGIAISAYISEIYMQDIDNKIKSLPNVIYYARYVDDIIVVITPNQTNEELNYLEEIRKFVKNEKLELNEKKTKKFDLRIPVKKNSDKNYSSESLEFLGYKYYFSNLKNGNIDVGLTSNKKKKYFKKIKLSFEEYTKNSKYNEKKARKLLVKRIRYLSENTKLVNVKKYIMIGIYFSNPLLNKIEDLKCLDLYLNKKINNIQCYDKLLKENGGYIILENFKTRLKKFSFEKGFEEKRFCKFTSSELIETTKIWEYIK
jgi:hypothetical protein